MSFTDDPWITMEWYIDGSWVDITADTDDTDGGSRISSSGITITRGQSVADQRANPSQADFRLFNRDGKYLNTNPRSPYFGLLPPNVPCRIKIDPYESYVRMTHQDYGLTVWAADSATLDVTGDIDIRCEIWPHKQDSYSYPLLTKYSLSGDNRSFYFGLNNGTPTLYWSTDGTLANRHQATATTALPTTGRVSVRVTLDVNNGASGRDIKFYYATDGIAGTYTQLGTTITESGTTSIYASTAIMRFGGADDLGGNAIQDEFTRYFTGKLYKFQLYSGISGTLVADADFTDLEPDVTTCTDGTTTFHIDPPNFVMSDSIRFYGYIPRIPATATDGDRNIYSDITAYDILQILNTGALISDSAMTRYYKSITTNIGYWPGEDVDGSGSIAAVTANTNSAVASGINYAAEDSLPGSNPVFTIDTETLVSGRFPKYTSTGHWAFTFALYLDTAPSADIIPMNLALTDGTNIEFRVGTFTYRVTITDYDTTQLDLADSAYGSGAEPGNWIVVVMEFEQNGSDIDWVTNWRTLSPGVGYFSSGTISSRTLGNLSSWSIPNLTASSGLTTVAIGHIAGNSSIDDYLESVHLTSFRGYVSETDVDRIQRLATENGHTVYVLNETHGTPMGKQQIGTALDLYTACADTGRGVLAARRDSAALLYISRAQLEDYEPLPLTYSDLIQATVDSDLIPINQAVVSRDDGGTYTDTVTTGPNSVDNIGQLSQPYTLNAEEDAQLKDIAHTITHIGTWNELRWFGLIYELAKPAIADNSTLLEILRSFDIGISGIITGLPDHLPTRDAEISVIELTEILTRYQHTLTLNSRPARPFAIAQHYNSTHLIGSSQSVLASSVTDSATTISVTGGINTVWAYTADFYISVSNDKEKMLVTNITGTSVPFTFTVTRGSPAFAHDADAEVHLWDNHVIGYDSPH